MSHLGAFCWLAIGAITGVVFVYAIRSVQRYEWMLNAIALLGASLVYLGAASIFEQHISWISLELAGTAMFALFAAAGARHARGWLTLGWILHSMWDICVHLLNSRDKFMPKVYPLSCIGFDLTVAAYLCWRSAHASGHKNPAPRTVPSS